MAEYVCAPILGDVRDKKGLFKQCVGSIPGTVKTMLFETCVYDYRKFKNQTDYIGTGFKKYTLIF